MEIIEAVKTRKSVRAYKPDPVPAEVLREILEISVRAPSAMNTQPWEFTVVTGQPLEKMRWDNVEYLLAAGKDVLVFNYTGVCRNRCSITAEYAIGRVALSTHRDQAGRQGKARGMI